MYSWEHHYHHHHHWSMCVCVCVMWRVQVNLGYKNFSLFWPNDSPEFDYFDHLFLAWKKRLTCKWIHAEQNDFHGNSLHFGHKTRKQHEIEQCTPKKRLNTKLEQINQSINQNMLIDKVNDEKRCKLNWKVLNKMISRDVWVGGFLDGWMDYQSSWSDKRMNHEWRRNLIAKIF